jgi:hypothetical protein
MWGWLKGLWSSKGNGGCITVDGSSTATLTPLEPKLSSRSCKGTNQDVTGVQQVVKQLPQGATGSYWQLQPLHTGACSVAAHLQLLHASCHQSLSCSQ